MAETQEQPPPAEIVRQGYEPAHIPPRPMLMLVIGFILTAVVLHTGLWFLEKYYARIVRIADVPKSLVPRTSLFTEPHLQPTEEHDRLPQQDMDALRAADREVFGQLGWKPDPQTGEAMIPDSIVSGLAERYARKPASGPAPATTRKGEQP